MNVHVFALVNDLDVCLDNYRLERAEYDRLEQQLRRAKPRSAEERVLQARKDTQFGVVLEHVNRVVRTIKQHEDALAD